MNDNIADLLGKKAAFYLDHVCQKITKDEAINIVETILIKANKENIKFNQKELDVFFKSIKLLELNSKSTTVLTYLLLSILEKESK